MGERASSWLHPLRSWSLRGTRYGSERWFALLADKQIKRGVHRSVHELKAAITAFIQAHNDDPKPFVWTKSADAILQTIARYCSKTLAVHPTTYSPNR